MTEPNLDMDWLERDKHVIGGLDHLGIEVVSAGLYGLMLPGISNLTERARYFAFYPWVLHEFAQRPHGYRNKKAWRFWLRSLEFGYALACAAHEKLSDADNVYGVIGAVKARAVLRDLEAWDQVSLKQYIDLNEKGLPSQGTYFSNPEGGYGQYYKGPLTSLGLLAHGAHDHPNRQVTNYAGRPAALATASTKGFPELLAIAEAGAATVTELAEVGAKVHPAALCAGSEEALVLAPVILGEDDELCAGQLAAGRHNRRLSLLLMLHLVHAAEEIEGNFTSDFRWCCLTEALPSAEGWFVPDSLRGVRRSWGAYQRNEVFNYALECLFWAALEQLDERPCTPRALAGELARLACEAVPATDDEPALPSIGGTVSASLSQVVSSSKSCGGPRDAGSLFAWTTRLEEASDVSTACAMAVRVLLRLASEQRDYTGHPFEAIDGGPQYASLHEIHLERWYQRLTERRDERALAFFEDLILEWILFRHLRVAMRKLANQGDSTFKFRPEGGELIAAAENVPPTYTSPRVRQAHRILGDLHFLSIDGSTTTITALGRQLLGRAV